VNHGVIASDGLIGQKGSDCVVTYDWYLGQGKVMHQQSLEEAAVIEAYLREVAPLANHLFKYLRFDLTK